MSAPLPCDRGGQLVGGASARRAVRNTWTHGQNAGAPSPSQPRAHTTRMCWLRACELSSSDSRVLPMPGSPDSSTSRPRPGLHFAEPAEQAQPFVGAPDEGGARRFLGLDPEVALAGRRRVPAEVRVLGEDLLLERPQLGPGSMPSSSTSTSRASW